VIHACSNPFKGVAAECVGCWAWDNSIAPSGVLSRLWSVLATGKYEEIPRPAGSPLGNSVACN
jgi:hypothetical protein